MYSESDSSPKINKNGGVIILDTDNNITMEKRVHWDEQMIARRASDPEKEYKHTQLEERDKFGIPVFFLDPRVLGSVKRHTEKRQARRSMLSDRKTATLLKAEQFANEHQIFHKKQNTIKIGKMLIYVALSAGLIYIFYYFMDQFKGGKSNRKTRKNKRAITN